MHVRGPVLDETRGVPGLAEAVVDGVLAMMGTRVEVLAREDADDGVVVVGDDDEVAEAHGDEEAVGPGDGAVVVDDVGRADHDGFEVEVVVVGV